MRFDVFPPRKLRAALTGDDLTQYCLTYESIDYDDSKTRGALLHILEKACAATGWQPPQNRLLVEIYPNGEGCVIYFSGRTPSARAAEEIAVEEEPAWAPNRASGSPPLVFLFRDCESMITACSKAFRLCCHRIRKSALYYLDGHFCLIIYPPEHCRESESLSAAFLCEYARPCGSGEILAAYVVEHGQPVAEENAIDRISYYLS